MEISGDPPTTCDLCGPPIDLGERGVLSLHHGVSGDEDRLRSVYEQLDQADLTRRFFTPGIPNAHFLTGWVDIASKGGLCLLAVIHQPDGSEQVVAEAGYSLLVDGDVELGITVVPGQRGWIGGWLLDVLLGHAHADGIENMQALVKTGNRPMLDLIRHRGCARFDEADWCTTRVTMSTTGHVPSWPPESARPRVLIESERSRPDSARRVADQAGTVLICGGFDAEGSHCPLHNGGTCPLIEGADAVIVDRLVDAEADLLPDLIESAHPDANVIVVDHGPTGLPERRPSLDLHLEDEGP